MSERRTESRIGPSSARQRRLEEVVRAEYERCRPDDTFDDLKRRSRFEKDSKGLLKHWLEAARRRFGEARVAQRECSSPQDQRIAA